MVYLKKIMKMKSTSILFTPVTAVGVSGLFARRF